MLDTVSHLMTIGESNLPGITFEKGGITYIRPSARLSSYVDLYTHFEGKHLPRSLRAYPQNYTEIWIHFADIPFYISSGKPAYMPAMCLIGPNSAPKEYVFEGNFNSLHIAFRLGGEKPFLGYLPAEFQDTPLPLDSLLPRWKVQAICELALSSPLQQVITLEYLLALGFQYDFDMDTRIQQGINIIHQHRGRVDVMQLAHQLNLSERQLLRNVKFETGLTPKKIIRLKRFSSVLLHVNQTPLPDFTRIALEHGYSDQSHFIREFAHFAGITPTTFLKRRETVGFLLDEWPTYLD